MHTPYIPFPFPVYTVLNTRRLSAESGGMFAAAYREVQVRCLESLSRWIRSGACFILCRSADLSHSSSLDPEHQGHSSA